MDLPLQLLQHITAGLPPADQDDRRRAPRQRHAAWVHLTQCETAASPTEGLSATLWNISPGGAGILLPRELKQDDRLILHLPHPENGQTRILCRVAHIRTKSPGRFLVGLEFERLLPNRIRIPAPCRHCREDRFCLAQPLRLPQAQAPWLRLRLRFFGPAETS